MEYEHKRHLLDTRVTALTLATSRRGETLGEKEGQ